MTEHVDQEPSATTHPSDAEEASAEAPVDPAASQDPSPSESDSEAQRPPFKPGRIETRKFTDPSSEQERRARKKTEKLSETPEYQRLQVEFQQLGTAVAGSAQPEPPTQKPLPKTQKFGELPDQFTPPVQPAQNAGEQGPPEAADQPLPKTQPFPKLDDIEPPENKAPEQDEDPAEQARKKTRPVGELPEDFTESAADDQDEAEGIAERSRKKTRPAGELPENFAEPATDDQDDTEGVTERSRRKTRPAGELPENFTEPADNDQDGTEGVTERSRRKTRPAGELPENFAESADNDQDGTESVTERSRRKTRPAGELPENFAEPAADDQDDTEGVTESSRRKTRPAGELPENFTEPAASDQDDTEGAAERAQKKTRPYYEPPDQFAESEPLASDTAVPVPDLSALVEDAVARARRKTRQLQDAQDQGPDEDGQDQSAAGPQAPEAPPKQDPVPPHLNPNATSEDHAALDMLLAPPRSSDSEQGEPRERARKETKSLNAAEVTGGMTGITSERLEGAVAQSDSQAGLQNARSSSPAIPARQSFRELDPERIGSYRIIRRLGLGGMGIVYEAFDEDLNRKAALKVLRTESASESQIDRFMMEAKAAAAINHPNIIQVYAVGKYEGNPFFAMELVEGRDLESILADQSHPFTVAESVGVISSCVRALEVAQEHGIVHRDIKPGNIMVNNKGMVKVMDFGIAKASKLTQDLTSEGQILGTPNYISPEQATGAVEVDFRADMYSLGCVFYQCLTGRLPFVAETPLEVICCHVMHAPEPIHNLNAIVPFALCSIVERMMAKDPDHRYQTQAELLTQLENFMAQLEDFDLPPSEMQIELGWHATDPEGRPPRSVQLKRKAKKGAHSQVIFGRLMDLSGESGRRQRMDTGLTASDLAGHQEEKKKQRWSTAHLAGLAATVVVLVLIAVSSFRSNIDNGPEKKETFQFARKEATIFLPPGWKLDAVFKKDNTEPEELREGAEWERSTYRVRYTHPQADPVVISIVWSRDGISPIPSPRMFGNAAPPREKPEPKVDKKKPEPKAETVVLPPIAPKVQVAVMWNVSEAAAWGDGKPERWAGRDGVLVARAKGDMDPFLVFKARNASQATRESLVVSGRSTLLLRVQARGGNRLKVQVSCKNRKKYFSMHRDLQEGAWHALRLPCEGFRETGGERLVPGDKIDNVGLFLEETGRTAKPESDQWWLALVDMKLLPDGEE